MAAERPAHLVLVGGTGTEVGKTWVASRLAERWRGSGRRVSARKPVQSFDPGGEPTDAEVLAAATGEDLHDVCPSHRWYGMAMAPFMAADALDRPPFDLADLVEELVWPAGVEVGLVEAAGGVRSPIATDGGDTVDLASALRPDAVVLVADAGLGTINASRLSLDALGEHRVVVFLNRFDTDVELHIRNHRWLDEHLPVPVVADLGALAGLVGPSG